jgi:hypoxanthine phosphoribosyltransferase
VSEIEPGETPVQQAIPLLWRHVRPDANEQFAHPAERDFSSVLTYYRVRWSYEPTSFPLEWGEDGRPLEMFTPDFYLPDQRLYVELTTMRQRLVTRKNRKLRRLKELYPDIRIKLLYRRDYHQFVDCYLRPPGKDDASVPGRVLFSEEEIARRVGELADEIARSELGRPEGDGEPLLIMVASRGAQRFARDLGEQLNARNVPIEWDRAQLTRSRDDARLSRVRLRRRPMSEPGGRRVLVLTDVVSTGLSTAYFSRWLIRRGARDVAVCTLLDRPDARLASVPVRFAAFTAPNELLVGYGLQLRRKYAQLPAIHTLVQAAAPATGIAQ